MGLSQSGLRQSTALQSAAFVTIKKQTRCLEQVTKIKGTENQCLSFKTHMQLLKLSNKNRPHKNRPHIY